MFEYHADVPAGRLAGLDLKFQKSPMHKQHVVFRCAQLSRQEAATPEDFPELNELPWAEAGN